MDLEYRLRATEYSTWWLLERGQPARILPRSGKGSCTPAPMQQPAQQVLRHCLQTKPDHSRGFWPYLFKV